MARQVLSDDERMILEPAAFVAALRPEEAMLIRIRDELYDGSWKSMRRDLNNRLKGRPYIFKLVNRIEQDLAAVGRLCAYEENWNVDLAKVRAEGIA